MSSPKKNNLDSTIEVLNKTKASIRHEHGYPVINEFIDIPSTGEKASDRLPKRNNLLTKLASLIKPTDVPIDDFTKNYLSMVRDPLARSIIHWLGGFDTFGRISMDMNGSGVDVILPMHKSQYDIQYFFNENSAYINVFMNEFSAKASYLEGKRLLNDDMGYSYEDMDKAAQSVLGDSVQDDAVFIDLARWAVFNAVLSLSVDYAVYHVVN